MSARLFENMYQKPNTFDMTIARIFRLFNLIQLILKVEGHRTLQTFEKFAISYCFSAYHHAQHLINYLLYKTI